MNLLIKINLVYRYRILIFEIHNIIYSLILPTYYTRKYCYYYLCYYNYTVTTIIINSTTTTIFTTGTTTEGPGRQKRTAGDGRAAALPAGG